MSQVYPFKYEYRVCPFCNSKKLVPVALIHLDEGEHFRAMSEVSQSGHLCRKCNRYHTAINRKYIYDRAEMRRDIARLQKFLDGEAK